MNLKAYLERRARATRDTARGKMLWRKAETLDDAGHLVAMWLRQGLHYLPWDRTPVPYPETLKADGFAEAMARVNDLGVVTICSQPGVSRQREFVEVLLDDDVRPLRLVPEVAQEVGVEVARTPDLPFPFEEAVPVTLTLAGRPFTRLGGCREDVAEQLGYGSPALGVSVARGRYTPLALYDEQFGRRGRVQDALGRIADRLQAGALPEAHPQ